ncbi:ribonuclease domain-containing protein [Paenibacillus sp. 1P07SE]|uniref:ribonuclease domain-containing protein n=1 Tax=Paenibacillus sp. 1P07SE TaxID=3132209 RepID=UPI0039A5AC26
MWRSWCSFLLISLTLLVLAGCGVWLEQPGVLSDPSSAGQMTPEDVADYIRQTGELPDNYLTKQEARDLGWDPQKGNLHDVAPGMSIGGDRFYNRERLLPDSRGRLWYEADILYDGGRRGAARIVYSNDGLIYMTEDHYKTFTQME